MGKWFAGNLVHQARGDARVHGLLVYWSKETLNDLQGLLVADVCR